MKDIKTDKKPPVRRNPNRKAPPKAPKINFMWLYAVVILALLIGTVFMNAPGPKEIDQERFLSQMLKNHDVDQ